VFGYPDETLFLVFDIFLEPLPDEFEAGAVYVGDACNDH